MSLVWERAPYTAGSLLVLLALADWSNDDGESWPSIPRIASKTRLERRSIQYIIRGLKKDGILEIEEGRGRGHQHHYCINAQKLRLLPSLIKGENDDIEKAQLDAQKAQSTTEKVQPIAPDPLVDPLVDPSMEPSEPRAQSRPKRISDLSEDEFFTRLESNEAYAGIDIRRLNEKMKTWCEVHGKRPTRRRLVNWLNREDRPMENGNGKNQKRFESSSERNSRNLRENVEYIRGLQNGGGEADCEDPIGLLASGI